MTLPPPQPRRTSRIIALTAAATLVLAAGAALAAWQLGWLVAGKPTAAPAATVSALSAETQVECANIRHEYFGWNHDWPKLVTAVTADRPRDLVRFDLDGLMDGGKALLKAVSGYGDQPSKELAVAVATYNFDLGLVILEHQLSGGTFTPETKDKAVASAGEVQTAYRAFMQSTCGEKA